MKYIFFLFFPLFASSQDAYTVEYVDFVQRMNAGGIVQCYEIPRDEAFVKQLIENANASGLHIISETIGRRNKKGDLLKGPQAAGLDIILRGTTQLDGNAAAKQAFINAAATWEAKLKNPVIIVMDVDFGTTRFGTAYGANVLGSTSSAVFTLTTVTMRQYAESLKTRNPQYAALYNNILDTLPNTTAIAKPNPSGTLANLQAIGFRAQKESLAFGSAPSIGFNSAFPYDFDPSNGINLGQTDFDAVAVHEMGHALGFVSVIGSTGSARTWDLFRFRPGVVTDTNVFRTTQRVLTPGPSGAGGDQIFWDGNIEWETSTATGSQTGGDGNQASHWRADEQRNSVYIGDRTIGIMDPTISSGVRDTILIADMKALVIMGWQADLPKLIYEPLNFTAFSNYTTPKTVKFTWKNPSQYFDGTTFTNYKTVVFRNEVKITEFDNAVPNANVSFNDTSVTQYTQYAYRFVNVSKTNGDSGRSKRVSLFAGGSAYPAAGNLLSFSNNGAVVALRVQVPSLHRDNTPLSNLTRAIILRTASGNQSLLDSISLTSNDTGKTIYFTDISPVKVPSYDVGFLGDAPFRAFSTTVGTSSIAMGKVLTATYSESFDVTRATVVSAYGWDSTNVAAHTGTYSLGALSYANNANIIAYLPAVKGNGNPILAFWTVCRTEAGKDFGKVEVSKNRGASWTEVLSIDESAHSEWSAGNNVWFKYTVSLSAYATDTIFVRFRLTSDGATSKFGWLIDDVTLEPAATGVADAAGSLPAEYNLAQNYPNPFNPSTRISYAIKEQGFVTLKVYDLLGKEVRTLVSSALDAGFYSVDLNGAALSSGVYFYQLRAGNFVDTKKFVLMK